MSCPLNSQARHEAVGRGKVRSSRRFRHGCRGQAPPALALVDGRVRRVVGAPDSCSAALVDAALPTIVAVVFKGGAQAKYWLAPNENNLWCRSAISDGAQASKYSSMCTDAIDP